MASFKDWIINLENLDHSYVIQLQEDYFSQFAVDFSTQLCKDISELDNTISLCFKGRSNGLLHGFCAQYRSDGIFKELSIYTEGVQTALMVQRLEGGSYLICGEPIAQSVNATYLYPCYQRGIAGVFELRKNGAWALMEGTYGIVNGQKSTRTLNFLPIPIIDQSRHPLLEDPYEDESVFVAQSGISPQAGEGLFAKRHIKCGELVALFSGLREVKHDRSTTIRADEEAWSDYRLTLDSSIDLDVPIELTSLDKYRATLGHKACHSFSKRNARFENLWHPRFGRIMSIVAMSDIPEGTEVLVKYGYDMRIAPQWYKQLYEDFKQGLT